MMNDDDVYRQTFLLVYTGHPHIVFKYLIDGNFEKTKRRKKKLKKMGRFRLKRKTSYHYLLF